MEPEVVAMQVNDEEVNRHFEMMFEQDAVDRVMNDRPARPTRAERQVLSWRWARRTPCATTLEADTEAATLAESLGSLDVAGAKKLIDMLGPQHRQALAALINDKAKRARLEGPNKTEAAEALEILDNEVRQVGEFTANDNTKAMRKTITIEALNHAASGGASTFANVWRLVSNKAAMLASCQPSPGLRSGITPSDAPIFMVVDGLVNNERWEAKGVRTNHVEPPVPACDLHVEVKICATNGWLAADRRDTIDHVDIFGPGAGTNTEGRTSKIRTSRSTNEPHAIYVVRFSETERAFAHFTDSEYEKIEKAKWANPEFRVPLAIIEPTLHEGKATHSAIIRWTRRRGWFDNMNAQGDSTRPPRFTDKEFEKASELGNLRVIFLAVPARTPVIEAKPNLDEAMINDVRQATEDYELLAHTLATSLDRTTVWARALAATMRRACTEEGLWQLLSDGITQPPARADMVDAFLALSADGR